MDERELLALDLNLLVVLHVLLRERSVSRTAAIIGRSQSATSHALARLRAQLDDPLFVRVGGEMHPTAYAARIGPALRRSLQQLGAALDVAPPFDPRQTTRTFRLAGPDLLSGVYPRLIAKLSRQAPCAMVELVGTGRQMPQRVLEGQLDAFVAPMTKVRLESLDAFSLGAISFAVFGRDGHPAFRRWGRRAWTKWPHVLVRTDHSPQGFVAASAERAGLERTVNVAVPSFAHVAPLLASTDLLFTGPRLALARAAEAWGLRQREVPFEVSTIEMALFACARRVNQPDLQWFCEGTVEALRPAFEEGRARPSARSRRAGLQSAN